MTRGLLLWSGVVLGSLAIGGPAAARPEERPRGTYLAMPAVQRVGPRVMFLDGVTTVIFMNRQGGHYQGGWMDDSSSNTSTVLGDAAVDLPAYPYGDGSWDQLMACMRSLYAPFDVVVTDQDPGASPHLEVVVAGHPNMMGFVTGVGGVAPLACMPIENAVVYAYPETYGDDPQGICEAAGQESAHAFGLDHQVLCEDVMTYLQGCGPKSFQDQDAACGEGAARPCYCGGEAQNSYRYLLGVLGQAPIDEPPAVTITRPAEGDVVARGFGVEATASDDNALVRLELYLDGALYETDDAAPWLFQAPSDLPAGAHRIEVLAIDGAEQSAMDDLSVMVEVEPSSDPGIEPGTDPESGTDPGVIAPEPGALGAPCLESAACDTHACALFGREEGYCTRSCEDAACPDDFECAATELGTYCVTPEDGRELRGDEARRGYTGGCAAAGGGGPGTAGLWILALASLMVRRRRPPLP